MCIFQTVSEANVQVQKSYFFSVFITNSRFWRIHPESRTELSTFLPQSVAKFIPTDFLLEDILL